jgi:hypothetical protein
LIDAGFKRDFSILHAFTTHHQNEEYGLEEFMGKLGFKMVFRGGKSSKAVNGGENKGFTVQRHLETGDLFMWAVTPEDYDKSIKAFKKELEALKDEIDPPKKPCPKRQKFPTLLLSGLRKAKLVQDNAGIDNPLSEILLVPEDVLFSHLQIKYGFDIKAWCNRRIPGRAWTSITSRTLKNFHVDWKAELL